MPSTLNFYLDQEFQDKCGGLYRAVASIWFESGGLGG